MIAKKEGVINEIIYRNTVYHNGENRMYPTLSGLKNLIQEIINSKSTTKYVRFTPFYNNEKLNQQIEFDEYMFYLECREQVDSKSLEKHIGLCLDKEYADMNDEEVNLGKILFPLCQYNDIETYKESLEAYIDFLDELMPMLMEISKSKMGLSDEDLAFGHFCFEVHSE